MKLFFLLVLLPSVVLASDIPPTPFPVFLKAGFSSVLEFDEAPTRVVLGDPQSFQVEKLESSIVIKTLTAYATTNMFVYFREEKPRLFVLTASEDAQPTYYKKFEKPVLPIPPTVTAKSRNVTPKRYLRESKITNLRFDTKKDYLTVELEIGSDSISIIRPNWELVRLVANDRAIKPIKLWSERKDIQKDTVVKARFIFAKPNLSRSMTGARIVIPLEGDNRTISLALNGGPI